MNRTSVAGCCASANFYNLGWAHGHDRYPSHTQFAKQLMQLGQASINIAITNEEQKKEEEYLKACGFKEVFTAGRLTLFAASAKDITTALVDIKKQLEEERIQKEKERFAKLKEQAELKKKQEAARLERFKAEGKTLPKKIDAKYVQMMRDWASAETRRVGLRIGKRETCNHFFGISPNFGFDLWEWERNSDIARTINRFLERQALK